jgi:NAD(P)-dependent dehydrogenase (short-subunit alcohol dehydrogenase family)
MITADLSGKTALVTGASSGFGAHFSKTLAAAGAKLVVAARREERLATLVKDIESGGGRASAMKLDVADGAAVMAAFEQLGAVDIVVNNAGVSGATRALETPEEEWRWTYDVNVHGVFFVAQAAAQRMVAAGRGGSIINIASITAARPAAGNAAYASSKAAVAHLTRCLALDWARHDIRVNALAPGYFETDINREFLASDYGQKMIRRIPQRRTGELHDLDGPLLLLASDASSYMTGTCIAVDGGHLCGAL